MFHESFDGTALACGVSTFHQNNESLAGQLDPVLHLQEFNLQLLLVLLVNSLANFGLVRIRPVAKQIPDFLVAVANFTEDMRRVFGNLIIFFYLLFCTRAFVHVPSSWYYSRNTFAQNYTY